MHTITADWIFSNKTERGGWTKQQLRLIGISWPAGKGWIEQVAGTQISLEAKSEFEKAALPKPGKMSELQKIKSRMSNLTDNQLTEIVTYAKVILNEADRKKQKSI